MSFLSGAFLLALPLAAVPVILHLYRRRQRTVVPWGAMQFLTAATKQGRRSERFEELLLMLLRAAAVLALVLAFARPQISGAWFGEHPAREVILVLDDSLSMSRHVSGSTPFEHLIRQAESILEELTPDDVVQVVTAVGGPQWLTSEALSADAVDRDRLLSEIKTMQPTDGAADLFSCLQAAVAVDPAADVRARHVVVLTDGQAHGWHLDGLPAWRRLQDAARAAAVPVSLQAISCGFGDEPVENLAVMGMHASQTQVGLREEVTVRVDVQNVGDARSEATSLQTYTGDGPLEELEIPALAVGETTTLQWRWQSGDAGVYALGCRLRADDQLAADNADAVVVEVVAEVPVLVVQSPAAYRQRMRESTFFTTALGYEGDVPHAAWHSVFAPHPVSVDDFEQTSLGQYQAVVITDVPPLVAHDLDRLREFVERGGGLWVTLGQRTDREAFNSLWYDDGGGLSPLPLGTLVTHAGEGRHEAMIHPPSADHVATAQLADTNRLDIDTVRIKSRHRFEPPVPGQELSVLLETGDGEPLVIEHYVGRGRVIIQALPFDVEWSNLPLTKAYVVMVHDWLAYLTQPAATQYNLLPGGRVEWIPPASTVVDTVTIALPSGLEKALSLREIGGTTVYRYSQTHVPGQYDIRWASAANKAGSVPYRVVRDAGESDLTPLTSAQQQALADAAGLLFPEQFDNLIPAVAGGSREVPVWNRLLAALLILLAVELFLAMRAARRRAPASSAGASLATGEALIPPAETEDVRRGWLVSAATKVPARFKGSRMLRKLRSALDRGASQP